MTTRSLVVVQISLDFDILLVYSIANTEIPTPVPTATADGPGHCASRNNEPHAIVVRAARLEDLQTVEGGLLRRVKGMMQRRVSTWRIWDGRVVELCEHCKEEARLSDPLERDWDLIHSSHLGFCDRCQKA